MRPANLVTGRSIRVCRPLREYTCEHCDEPFMALEGEVPQYCPECEASLDEQEAIE